MATYHLTNLRPLRSRFRPKDVRPGDTPAEGLPPQLRLRLDSEEMVPGGGFEPPTRGFSILIRHIPPISSRDTDLHKSLFSYGFCFLRFAGVFRAFPRRGTGVVPALESRRFSDAHHSEHN